MLIKRVSITLLLCCACLWQLTRAQDDDEDCVDKQAICAAIKSYCNHPQYINFAKTNCAKTCKFCAKDLDPDGLCTTNNGGCDHDCNVIDKKVKECTCYSGYELRSDNATCRDIDECQVRGICPNNQFCSNTAGGFTCDKIRCDSDENKSPYMGRAECCTNEPDDAPCGVIDKPDKRILGGNVSNEGQWPWQVLIVIDGSVLCGGTLISNEWVVTAGHCFRGYNENTVFKLFFGALKLEEPRRKNVEERSMKKHVLYPNWNGTEFQINDIALIQLDEPVPFNKHIKPVCLPNGERPKVGTLCFAAGWGLTEEGGSRPSTVLQHVDLPIVDGAKCEKNYESETRKVDKRIMTCAGYDEGGKDACRGDSGGPLVCQRCDSCGWYLAGVVSFGSGCGRKGLYGVYVDVPRYEEWISQETSIPVTKDRSCTGPYFTPWSNWSTCTQSCGSGARHTRSRECRHKGSKSEGCEGARKQTEDCPTKKCPTLGKWRAWSKCTQTCGGGERTRRRNCNNGEIGQDGCPVDEAVEVEPCNSQECPQWSKWSDWSKCTRSCGGGESKRTRKCEGGKSCEGDAEESVPCKEKACPGWESWSEWSVCSKSCATGMKTSNRVCVGEGECPGPSSREQTCNSQPCPVFGKWEAWDMCDVTCGGGNRQRRRQCENGKIGDVGCKKGDDTQREACNTQDCPRFSPWSTWGKCSVTCGGGEQQATRTCQNGEVGEKGCVGNTSTSQACAQNECIGVFEDWTEWTKCTKSCDEGTQTRKRPCVGGTKCNGKSEEQRSCELRKCPVFGKWKAWKDCSKSCEGGNQERTRECLHTDIPSECDGEASEKRCCNKHPCPGKWTAWGPWSECDVTCGEGTSRRSRDCEGGPVGDPSCGDGPAEKTKNCQEQPCPSDWGKWENWSSCSKSCDRGLLTRTRQCEGGKVGTGGCVPASAAMQQQPCNEVLCLECSNVDERYCEQNFASASRCRAYPSFAELYCSAKCDLCPGLYEHWNEWGSCSSTCGQGTRRRTRECQNKNGCEGDESEDETCQASCRGFSSWSQWTVCSKSCNGGKRTRTRTCPFDRCDPDERGSSDVTEEEDCNTNPCPGKWGPWRKWGACTVSCGDGGTEERTRECVGGRPGGPGCQGPDKKTRECKNSPACPAKWTEWTSWSKCSVSCGEGIIERTRTCENGIQGQSGCEGEDSESQSCDAGECTVEVVEWSNWGEWGECDASCERSRDRTCNGGKPGDQGCPGSNSQKENCDPSSCGATDTCGPSLVDLDSNCPLYEKRLCRTRRLETLCGKTCCEVLKDLPCEDDPQYEKSYCAPVFSSLCSDQQYVEFFQVRCPKMCGYC